MALQDVAEAKAGERAFMLGNEAIARGALEAGVDLVSGYPGTPSSEILDVLHALAPRFDLIAEYATNEKVAVEVAAGAALAGKRALATMKHVGVNVAADALFSLAMTGVAGALVVVSADDPSMHSSQNEQDNRLYGEHMHLPVLDPATPQEALRFTREAFALSERLEMPVLLRTTTRVNHASGLVTLGEIPVEKRSKARWAHFKDPARYVMVPGFARGRRRVLTRKVEEARRLFEESPLNAWRRTGTGAPVGIGVLTSGVAHEYVLDALELLGAEDEVEVLKLGTVYPLPEGLIAKFLKGLELLVVCEELEPYLEDRARMIAQRVNARLRIEGKRSGVLPYEFEYNTQIVVQGLSCALDRPLPRDFSALEARAAQITDKLPPRGPVFCPGCAHPAAYYALKRALGPEAVLSGDIGCYTLGVAPPHAAVDTCLCMGASIGLACGLARAVEEPVVAVIGDSTFFHAGLPALVHAVYHRTNLTVVVLDNDTTAMTGHQPHPGAKDHRARREEKRVLEIAEVARGLGVEDVHVVDPYDVEAMTQIARRCVAHEGVSLIVAKAPCALNVTRRRRQTGERVLPYVVTDYCTGCLECLRDFNCVSLHINADGLAQIDSELCTACGACAALCPERAIVQAPSPAEGTAQLSRQRRERIAKQQQQQEQEQEQGAHAHG